MVTTVHLKTKPPASSSAGLCKNALKDGHESNILITNEVESLKNRIIKASKSNADVPYTIVLVGEAGVGKSSLVELITNVLTGNDADHYNLNILDDTNEQGSPNSRSQTKEARLYEIPSKNGVVVRILDTPGLADEPHKQSFAAQIQEHVSSATAILVLANGTVPRGTGALHDPLATLSAVLPNPPASNTALVFTNVANPFAWNYCEGALPETLKSAPQFRVDNPVALHKKYLALNDVPDEKRAELRKAVMDSERDAWETLVELFDWLGLGGLVLTSQGPAR